MKITMAIPIVSFDRLGLLEEEIKSIRAGMYKNVYIVIIVDGDPELHEAVKEKFPSLNGSIILNKKRRGWVASINRVFREFDSEYYIYGSDDLVYPPDCIKKAMEMMKKCFPDGYGVVTLGRRPKAIFGLIGNKWVEHFPGRQVFCPFYTHYAADAEHTRFCKEIGKFAFPPDRECQVKHHRLNDETRRYSRRTRDKDRSLHKDRQARGRLWGVNYDL